MPNKILPGERRNLRDDKSAKSKYNGFMKFYQVILFLIHLLYNIILYIENKNINIVIKKGEKDNNFVLIMY